MLAVSPIGRKLVAGVLIIIGALAGGQVVQSDLAVASEPAINSISNLTVSYRPSSSSQTIFKLSCLPISAAGTHPNRKAICAAIAKQGAALFAPVAADTMCTQIYGGPETAKITGTVNGRKINAAYSRTDGCQIGRWNTAKTFFTFPRYATINGRIELSPTCPGPVRPGQECTNPSATGAVTITSKVQKSVKAQAVADIGFSVLLRMGKWTLTASQTGAMRCTPIIITVPTPGGVVITCDTGIR